MIKIIIRDIVIVIIFLTGFILLSNKIKTTPSPKTIEEVLLNDTLQALIENGIPEEVIRNYAGTTLSRNPRDSIPHIFYATSKIVPLLPESECTIKFKYWQNQHVIFLPNFLIL